jgi:hypothetical protein
MDYGTKLLAGRLHDQNLELTPYFFHPNSKEAK